MAFFPFDKPLPICGAQEESGASAADYVQASVRVRNILQQQ